MPEAQKSAVIRRGHALLGISDISQLFHPETRKNCITGPVGDWIHWNLFEVFRRSPKEKPLYTLLGIVRLVITHRYSPNLALAPMHRSAASRPQSPSSSLGARRSGLYCPALTTRPRSLGHPISDGAARAGHSSAPVQAARTPNRAEWRGGKAA